MYGEHQHNSDPKGRVSVPSKLRNALGETFMLSKGLDNCLNMYPMDEWKVIEDKAKALPDSAVDLRRFIFGGAEEVTMDKQGRILIPPSLRKYAKLEEPGSITVVGVLTKAEMWNSKLYEERNASLTNDYIKTMMRQYEF